MYSNIEEKVLGSLEDLTRLYKASTMDLVRHLQARKLPDGRYLIPIENVPWCTIFKLDREYLLKSGDRLLKFSISIEPRKIPTPVEICVGFLIKVSDFEYYCVGSLITGRKSLARCRFRIFQIPYDLWDFPKVIAIPELKAICTELSIDEHIDVIDVVVPHECILDLGYGHLLDKTTSSVIAITDLVAVMGNVKLKFYKDSVKYS